MDERIIDLKEKIFDSNAEIEILQTLRKKILERHKRVKDIDSEINQAVYKFNREGGLLTDQEYTLLPQFRREAATEQP